MQGRMGVALMVVVAGALAMGCANKQQQAAARERNMEQAEAKREQAAAKREQAEVKRRQKAEAEQARAEAKRQQDQARADERRQQAEAKRMAAADKRARAEERKQAEQDRRELAKYEKEQREAIGADMIRDERHERVLDRFVRAQAATGAREDLMLSDAHFEGGELNSLGRSKVALIASAVPAGSTVPVVVYVGGESEAAAQPRIAAVQNYWNATPHADMKLQVEHGLNDAAMAPANTGLNGLKKMQEQSFGGSIMSAGSAGAAPAAN